MIRSAKKASNVLESLRKDRLFATLYLGDLLQAPELKTAEKLLTEISEKLIKEAQQ